MTTPYYANLLAKLAVSGGNPPDYYMGLSKTNPATEVSEPLINYSRYDISDMIGVDTTNSNVITNTSNIVFPGGKSNYGVIEYYVVYDQPVNGNLLFYGKLAAPQLVLKNEALLFRQGVIKVYVQTKHDYDLSIL